MLLVNQLCFVLLKVLLGKPLFRSRQKLSEQFIKLWIYPHIWKFGVKQTNCIHCYTCLSTFLILKQLSNWKELNRTWYKFIQCLKDREKQMSGNWFEFNFRCQLVKCITKYSWCRCPRSCLIGTQTIIFTTTLQIWIPRSSLFPFFDGPAAFQSKSHP